MSGNPAFVRRTATGVTVELRALPQSRRTVLVCAVGALNLRMTTPAEDGKANAGIQLLAETWRLPKSAFAATRGTTSGDKVMGIAGKPALLAARIVDRARKSAGRYG